MGLTKEQSYASKNIDESLAVIAGAGTGKTSVLIERLKNIAGEDGNGMSKILAITFTGKATKEIIARLYKSFSPIGRINIPNATIGTFHAFCLKLLNNYNKGGLNIANEANNALINKRIASKAIADEIDSGNEDAILLLDDLGWFNCTKLIEDLLDFRWHALKVFSTVSNNKESKKDNLAFNMTSGAKAILTRAINELHKYFNENAITDFQQLEIDTLQLLENKEILNECQNKYKHILVDECQDTNDIQIQLIKKLFNPQKNILFIVGDPKQSIYRFRGANPAGFNSLTNIILKSDGKLIELNKNFRSSSNILSFINFASKSIVDKELYQQLEASNPVSEYGIKKLQILGEDKLSDEIRVLEAECIAKTVTELIQNGIQPNEIALLFRSINSADIYLEALKKTGIPCKLSGSKSFINQHEISDIISFLKWCEYNDEISEIAILRSPLISANDEELLTKDYLEFEIYKQLADLKAKSKEYVPADLIEELLSITGLRRIVCEIDNSGTKLGNIEHLVEVARSLPYPQSLSDLLDAIVELKNKSIRWGDPPSGAHSDAVSLLSVHGAKGLEWDIVILPDLIRKKPPNTFPWLFSLNKGLAFRPIHNGERIILEDYQAINDYENIEELNEEKRLIYVALTRAKKGIFISDVQNGKYSGAWYDLLKPLIKDCDVYKPIERHFKKNHTIISNEKYQQINFNPTMLSVSQLESFDRCPFEFYLRHFLLSKETFDSKSKKIPAHIKGRIIHSYINKLCQNMNHNQAIIDASLEEGILEYDELSRDALNVKSNIEKLLSSSILAEGYHELPFQWYFNGTIISGVIDWLRPKDNAYEIIDFKTDDITSNEASERAKSYELQLLIYALAIKSGGMNISGTKLLFVTPGEMIEHKFTITQEELTKTKLSKIINDISKRNFTKNKSNKCKKCPFFLKCK